MSTIDPKLVAALAARYRFLPGACSDWPFADDMRRGLAAAERCVGQLTE